MEKFKLPELKFAYNALEPVIDEKTIIIHHDKHHQAYLDKFNAAVEKMDIEETDIIKIFEKVSKYPSEIKNNGGGYYNHNLYFENLTPEKTYPSMELMNKIIDDFDSYENLIEELEKASINQFGSGWGWLILNKKGDLEVVSTLNQENPLMDDCKTQGIPLLAIDVWEHAYYLNYQNKRPEYVVKLMEIIDWHVVSERFKNIKK